MCVWMDGVYGVLVISVLMFQVVKCKFSDIIERVLFEVDVFNIYFDGVWTRNVTCLVE